MSLCISILSVDCCGDLLHLPLFSTQALSGFFWSSQSNLKSRKGTGVSRLTGTSVCVILILCWQTRASKNAQARLADGGRVRSLIVTRRHWGMNVSEWSAITSVCYLRWPQVHFCWVEKRSFAAIDAIEEVIWAWYQVDVCGRHF